jgi:TP901 family phage tail tape measure protein
MELFKLLGKIVIDGIDDASKSLEKISDKAKSVGEKISNAGDKISGVGKKMLPVTTAIGGIGVASAKMSMDFEDSMAKVSTIADESEMSMDDMRKAILKLSNDSGISASEIANNVYDAISAGQKTGDAVNFVTNSTKLAKAGFAEAGQSLDLLTTILNAYGLEASKVTNVSDMLIQTQNLGKTTVADLSSAMGKVIPTAKAQGVQLDELCASYAVMTSNGIATAETTTYLNSMLNELGKQGTGAANAFAKGTEDIKEGGLSMAEAMAQGWELTDVLEVLSEQAEESGTTIANMFGSAEAGKAAAVLWDNAKKLDETVASMGESAGSTEVAFEKLQTRSYKIEKAVNTLKNTAIELGASIMDAAAPAIEKFSEGVQKLSDWFTSLDDSQQQNIIKIGALVAAIAPALMIIGKLTSGIGSLIKVGGSLAGGIGKVTYLFGSLGGGLSGVAGAAGTASGGLGGLSGALGAIASPVGIVIAAITALVGVFIYLWNTNEEFRTSMTNTWNEIVETCSPLLEELKTALNDLWQNVLKPFIDFVGKMIAPVFQTVFQFIGEQLSAFLTVLTGVIEFITGIFTGDWEKAWGGIQKIFSGIFDGIKSTATTVMNLLKNIISSALTAIKSLFQTNLNLALNIVNSILTKVKDKFNTTMDNAKSVVSKGIEFIKKAFNVELKFPKIKLPHLSISGSFSLDPPSVPSFGIEWYKNGVILTNPTAFGFNPFTGKTMVGGEADDEAVAPVDLLLGYIRQAVAEQNNVMVSILTKILDKLDDFKPNSEGDIIIPIYFGNELWDEIIIKSKNNITLRSGGMANA